MARKIKFSILFFIAISILIHGINLAIIMSTPPKVKLEKVDIEYGIDKPNPNGKGEAVGAEKKIEKKVEKKADSDDRKILSKGADATDLIKPTGGYYGIGISVSNETIYITYQGKMYPAYVIESAYAGYPADSLGLLPGDAVFLVNGKCRDLVLNDIKGEGPTPVTLTIERKGRIFTVQAVRTWIDTYE